MTHGLIPHPAGAAVQGPTSTLCAELLRMIRRESAAGFARPRQDVRHPPHGNVRAFICRSDPGVGRDSRAETGAEGSRPRSGFYAVVAQAERRQFKAGQRW